MNQFFNNALTQETPGKVFGLLAAAMLSMAFMFAVSAYNASFNGAPVIAADPFSMENVASAMDNTANRYSSFLAANLFQPMAQTYQVYSDNIAFVANESGVSYVLGFENADASAPVTNTGQVAGAIVYTYDQYASPKQDGLFDSLYGLLIK